jgi:hypothetical protein
MVDALNPETHGFPLSIFCFAQSQGDGVEEGILVGAWPSTSQVTLDTCNVGVESRHIAPFNGLFTVSYHSGREFRQEFSGCVLRGGWLKVVSVCTFSLLVFFPQEELE